MYLHIGNKKNIRTSHIIGIFDTDNATVAGTTRKYLSHAQKQGRVTSATDDIPKSFIVYREDDIYRVCFSQLSTASLQGRLKRPFEGE